MALTTPVKHWLSSRSTTAQDIVGKINEKKITIADLEAYEIEKPAFNPVLAAVKALIAMMPDPEEEAEFATLQNTFNSDPLSDETFNALNSYITKWENKASASSHVETARSWHNRSDEGREFKKVENNSEKAIAEYNANNVYPSNDDVAAVNTYINNWEHSDFASEHVSKARQWRDIFANALLSTARNEWAKLFDENHKLKSIDLLKQFLATYSGISEFSTQGDHSFWTWALSQEDIPASVQEYDNYYRGFGIHSPEVRDINSASQDWVNLKNKDIFSLIAFAQNNSKHLFINQIKDRINSLKQETLDEIRLNPVAFDTSNFCTLLDSGYFTTDELKEAAGVTSDRIFELIRTAPNIKSILSRQFPDSAIQPNQVGDSGVTDIVFFGIPSSGKTCVLSGLLINPEIDFDPDKPGGTYGTSLRMYAKKGIAYKPTQGDFVAMIPAVSKDGKKNFSFNLVDMAGEAFRDRIAQALNANGDAIVTFEDMGTGATNILCNNNEKVFFLVVDPTKDEEEQLIQEKALAKLVGLMFSKTAGVNKNESIMRKVRGLHFVVTKADMLPAGNRLEHARNYVNNILGDMARQRLIESCKELGINYSKEKELDGRPRIFCFSLGNFTVGNVFEYNQNDSDIFVKVIRDYCSHEISKRGSHKLRDIMLNIK